MIDNNQHELLAQVASMYYDREMTQHEIAAQLGLSRVKVYRLLKQAKAEQVVQVTVNWPIQRDNPLENALKQTFQLKDALVLNATAQHSDLVLSRLGQLGARYLEHILSDGATMAVCLGRSTYEVIQAIRPGFQAKVQVAQAMGSMPFAMQELDSAALARQLAHKLGGEVLYLSAPLMADNLEAAVVLRRQRDIERTLAAARAADIVLLGIGNLDPATSGFAVGGFMTPAELTSLTAAGGVGDMAGQIYRLTGKLHSCSYNQRLIGLTLEELQRIPITIAVAAGEAKAKAVLGGLRTGAINVLCTDQQTAGAVLTINQQT
jgi:DNA-binding transcriptional regulator LsrR (DeoR family)